MPLPEMKHVIKSFTGVCTSEDVDLSMEQGEIHALLGEGGAGKATLMNILFGIYQADREEICFKGRNVEFKPPGKAVTRGTGMVHQHFLLVKEMTMSGNVMLGLEKEGIMANRESAREKLTGLATAYGLPVDPEAPVHTLSAGEQQRVKTLKVLYWDMSLLILDEPTGVSTPQETENFFGVLKQLRDKSYGVITITHRLEEVMDISDRVTMLRDSRKVRSLATEETMPEELPACMTRWELKMEGEIRESVAGETALNLKGVYLHKKYSARISLDHVSLTICRGEILGIMGVEDSGQKGLAGVITRIRRIKSGQMGYQGKDIRKDSVKERSWAGISYISDDHHGDSLVMDMTAEDNLILRDFDKEPFSGKMVLDYKQAERKAGETLDEYSIKISGESGIKTPVKPMSGGNQQKVVFSREVSGEADLVVASQPTRGLNIGATRFVHGALLRQRGAGRCVLLISADLDEVLGIGDCVAVMYGGHVIGILNRKEADVHKIGLPMGGIAKEVVNE